MKRGKAYFVNNNAIIVFDYYINGSTFTIFSVFISANSIISHIYPNSSLSNTKEYGTVREYKEL